MTDIKDEPRVATAPDDDLDFDIGPELEPEIPARAAIPLWKKLVAFAAFLIAIFALVVAYGNIRGGPEPSAVGTVPPTNPPVEVVAPEDSLGIRFDEVRELWNSVDQPPLLTRALRRTPENGELDSFRHGFDAEAEMIGAYRDQDDYLVALMARATLDHPGVSTLYLHVCHLVDSFSPECIDNYFTTGLAGQTLADLAATGHSTSWESQGNEWRVSVENNLLTIRVLAPGSN